MTTVAAVLGCGRADGGRGADGALDVPATSSQPVSPTINATVAAAASSSAREPPTRRRGSGPSGPYIPAPYISAPYISVPCIPVPCRPTSRSVAADGSSRVSPGIPDQAVGPAPDRMAAPPAPACGPSETGQGSPSVAAAPFLASRRRAARAAASPASARRPAGSPAARP